MAVERSKAVCLRALRAKADPRIRHFPPVRGESQEKKPLVAQLLLTETCLTFVAHPRGDNIPKLWDFFFEWNAQQSVDDWLMYAYAFLTLQYDKASNPRHYQVHAPELPEGKALPFRECLSAKAQEAFDYMQKNQRDAYEMEANSCDLHVPYSLLLQFQCVDPFNNGYQGSKLLPSGELVDHAKRLLVPPHLGQPARVSSAAAAAAAEHAADLGKRLGNKTLLSRKAQDADGDTTETDEEEEEKPVRSRVDYENYQGSLIDFAQEYDPDLDTSGQPCTFVKVPRLKAAQGMKRVSFKFLCCIAKKYFRIPGVQKVDKFPIPKNEHYDAEKYLLFDAFYQTMNYWANSR